MGVRNQYRMGVEPLTPRQLRNIDYLLRDGDKLSDIADRFNYPYKKMQLQIAQYLKNKKAVMS